MNGHCHPWTFWETWRFDMVWLRLVGSLKMWVSFAKDPYKRDLYSAKKSYIFNEAANRSHHIGQNTQHQDSTLNTQGVPLVNIWLPLVDIHINSDCLR